MCDIRTTCEWACESSEFRQLASAKLFTRIAPGVPLEWLMPLFWAGFSMTMFPASNWLARRPARAGHISASSASLLWQGGLIEGIAIVACATAPPLPLLIALQIVALLVRRHAQ